MNGDFRVLNVSVISTSDTTNLRGVPREFGGVQTPPPPHEIPKSLQNRAKLNPIVKTVKNC